MYRRAGTCPFAAITLFALIELAVPACAQMTSGEKIPGFAQTFGLSDRAPRDWAVREIASDPPANVLWPKEQAKFTFRIENKGPDAIAAKAIVHVVHYATRGTPGDFWKPIAFKIDELEPTDVELNVPGKGSADVEVSPKLPERFGAYGLVFDLGARGRQFAASCVRVPSAAAGRVWQPTYALDLPRESNLSEEVFALFQRLGIKAARMEAGAGTPLMAIERWTPWAMKHDVVVMLTVGAGTFPQPLGRPRPWLNDNGSMKQGVKSDMAWLPQYDPQFQDWITQVAGKFGWPNGPVNAMELWNEPWEGISISGWGADMLRYRELYTRMAQGVIAARQSAGVKVLIGGACSSTNTRDKLFCDGTDHFLPWLDFVSIHYQPLAADAALEPDWMHRQSDYGRTKVWDTESWVANSDDRVAAVIASMRSLGQDRTAGIYAGNVYEPQKVKTRSEEHDVVQAWAPAAAVAASQNFIGQRAFRQILFKNGLPWVYVFDGLPKSDGSPNPDDGTIVIVGDLGGSYDKARSLFRSVKIERDAKLQISDADRAFTLFDFYGNPLPATEGRIDVPLNGLGFFLRADGSPGSFDRLVKEVAERSRITGIDPVEIIARDLIAPVDKQPKIVLQITDVLNRPVRGKLSLSVEGLTLDHESQDVELNGNESRDVAFTVTGGAPNPSNAYGLTATFDTGADGTATHAEAVHVNCIARKTIQVDGDLADWSDVIPQNVGPAQHVGASKTEMAYLPFRDWTPGSNLGTATAYAAYDQKNFYFAAKVSTGFEPMVRFGTRDDDQYFYPATVTDRGQSLTWPEGVRRFSYRKNFEIPSGNGGHNVQIAFNVLPPEKKHMLPYPAGTMPRYMDYQDTDYEYALNLCADGDTEVFCLARPGAPRKHFYPRQPKAPIDGGPVANAKLVIKGDSLECAIPWSNMPEVKQKIDATGTIKFSFRINAGRDAYELAVERSVSKENPLAFHNDFATHWANELEFGAGLQR